MDRRLLLPAAAALALALTACGGGGDGGDATTTAGNSTPLAPAPAGTPGASGTPSASGTPAPAPIASSFTAFGPVTVANSNGPQAPAVARLAGGGSVVAWQLFNGALQMQRVDAAGQAVGVPITVAAAGSSSVQPAIVAMAGGGFVVAWADATSAGSTSRVLMRGFDASGTATTPVTQVSAAVTSIAELDAAALPDGGFVLTWAGTQLVGGPATVAVQRFDANATPVTQAQLTSPATANAQRHPQLAVLPDGTYLVAWLQAGASTALPSYTVNMQRFAANGTALGAERVLADTQENVTFSFDIAALSTGRLALVWQSFGLTPDVADLNLELLSADGTPLAPRAQIPAGAGVEVFDPHVASLGAGGFVVTWEKGSVSSIRERDATLSAQRFANDGTALEAAHDFGTHGLQTTTGEASGRSSLSAGTDGHFLLAYDRWLAGSFIDLLGR